jgi:hypothetical protein
MQRGRVVKRERSVDLSNVLDSSCWPSPKQADANGSRQLGYDNKAFNKSPTLTDAMLLYHCQPIGKGVRLTMALNPEFVERLVGLPEGWTHVADVPASEALETPL